MLVGLDMAFALPAPFSAPPRLWAEIEAVCAADDDLAGQRFAAGDLRFWRSGRQPADWIGTQRPAEIACIERGHGHPQTPLKLIGAKQVGLGSLAGARLLHRLHSRPEWSVWPFDGLPASGSVCVEIYPRLFIRHAGGGMSKLRDAASLDAALARFGCTSPRLNAFDDHESDALISAAGLRAFAPDPALWNAGLGQTQGWVFGVR